MSSSITEVDIGVEDVSFQEVGNTGGGLELLMNSSLKSKDSRLNSTVRRMKQWQTFYWA